MNTNFFGSKDSEGAESAPLDLGELTNEQTRLPEKDLEEAAEDENPPEASSPEEAQVEATQVEKQIQYTSDELKESYTILRRYQVKTDEMSDDEVVSKTRRILNLSKANVQVLSRGRTLDGIERLLGFLPDGFVGEFKRENDIDIARANGLGWEIFHSKEASKSSPTGKGDTLVRLGDQILMMMEQEKYIALQMSRDMRHQKARTARNPKKEAEKANKEEGFLAEVSPM